jgi:hypothetical protein
MTAGAVTLESGYIPGIRFLGGTTSVLDFPLEMGWNLLSVPFIEADFRKVSLYPTASTAAFAYQGVYSAKDTLGNGTGFFIKFGAPGLAHFTGAALMTDTVRVGNNWNMIAALSYPTLEADITPVDTSIFLTHFYGYKVAGGYYLEDTLMPGKAYWLKVKNPGRVAIRAGTVAMEPALAFRRLKEGKKGVDGLTGGKKSGTLTVRDANGREGVLYVSAGMTAEELAKWEMPPVPFEGMMDVRFSTNRILESADESKSKEVGIDIASAEYPVTVSWKIDDAVKGAKLRIDGREVPISSAGETRIPNASARLSVSFAPSAGAELPKQFALYQNYPNPFNPTTKIRYDLPRDSHVRIVVYDALGQEISEIVSQDQEAGYQMIEWYARNRNGIPVASGMYFYRIEAKGVGNTVTAGSTFTEVKKMLLVR